MWCKTPGACPPSATLQALAGGRQGDLTLAYHVSNTVIEYMSIEIFKDVPLHNPPYSFLVTIWIQNPFFFLDILEGTFLRLSVKMHRAINFWLVR